MLANKNEFKAAYEHTIDTLGVPATVVTVGGDSFDCTIGWKTTRDEELINSYGVGVKVATVKYSDVSILKKMDGIRVHADRYTIDEVFPVYLNDIQVGWRCVIRGK